MTYIFKLTALSDQWGKCIKKGETFTLVQTSSQPSTLELKDLIKKMGRNITTYDSLPSLGDKQNIKESNGWLIERVKN